MDDNDSQWSAVTGLSRISTQPTKQGPACVMQVQTNTHLWNGTRRIRYSLADKKEERPVIGSLLRIYKWRVGEFEDQMLIQAYQNLGGALMPMVKTPFWAKEQPKFTQNKTKQFQVRQLVAAKEPAKIDQKTLEIDLERLKEIFYKQLPTKMPEIIDLSDD